MEHKVDTFKPGVMKQLKALSNLSRLIILLAWVEMVFAIILAVYTYKNTHVFGESLTVILYGMAGFVFVFAFGKNLALLVDIRRQQEVDSIDAPVESYAYREQMMNVLRDLISRQKGSIFRRKYKEDILSILDKLTPTQQDAIEILDLYRGKYRKKLTSELEGLTSSYDLKKEYLQKFIDYNVVEGEYPHRLVKNEVV